MKTFKYGNVLFAFFGVLLLVQTGFSSTYRVCKTGDCPYKTIMEAVAKCGNSGDEIIVEDAATYAEQVTIDSTKNGLWLHSDPKLTEKPTIKYQDKINVGPKSAADALIDSLITFDQNGAVRVLRASRVRIEGFIIDGGGNFPFGSATVWGGTSDMQHGNAALTLWIAGDAIIRDCELQNAYIGINVKDRNEGGIFAHPNPADLDPDNIIPFSRFAKTGNHLVEYCRIHNNSVGMFFESAWDLGSTIRYNLIYENHHPTKTVADLVKTTTPTEGQNQGGGALMTKDVLVSPLAVYNNTFWHNSNIFLGNWKSGGQHLIFNNIFAEPNEYWEGSTTGYAFSFDMSKCFVNRMHNCVYTAQVKAPTTDYATITNDLRLPAQAKEGALITPFPATADVRWIEMTSDKFISVDPKSPDFLVPDWSNSLVADYIIDKGWTDAGVKDPNGTRADLGAIPSDGGRPKDIITIRPSEPVVIENGNATIRFGVSSRISDLADTNVTMVYLYAVTRLDTTNVFGSDQKPITSIQRIDIPSTKLIVGDNTIVVKAPSNIGDFAFFEMVLEGTGSDSRPFTSTVGFIPYRKLDYLLDVVVQDASGKAVTSVRAGDVVTLKVTARTSTGPFTQKIDSTNISLQSNYDFKTTTNTILKSIPGGIPNGTASATGMFTQVPDTKVEYVHVTATWIDKDKVRPFWGTSQGVTILAGPADSVRFDAPPSKDTDIINPGTPFRVKVKAFDKYGNLVDSSYSIKTVSLKPQIGRIDDSIAVTGFQSPPGTTQHTAMVTNGDKDQVFPIVATLVDKPTKTDTAYLKVGLPKDKLWIYFSDTVTYDPTARIDACAGIRVPVVIRASKDGKVLSSTRNTVFEIKLTTGLSAYANATTTEKMTAGTLVNGEIRIWITSTGRAVANGSISLISKEADVSNPSPRENINFDACNPIPQRGAYFTTNGRGAVDVAKIYYDRAIDSSEIPDSIVFFWPSLTGQSRIVKKQDVTIDPANKSIVVVALPLPFADGVTRYTESNAGLGNAFWKNPLTTDDAISQQYPFEMADSVGPLIATATLVERLVAGDDSLILTFTEPVPWANVKENGLTLIKKQPDGTTVPVVLQIVKAEPTSTGGTVVTVKDPGNGNTPKEGDSLKINPAGPIVDNSGNKAHALNRPVVLTLQKIAPTIESARYEDRNADGKIETVQITFNKPVAPGEVTMQFKWGTTSSSKVDSTRITVVNASTFDVSISGLFPDTLVKNRTSANISVTVSFNKYETNNVKNRTLDDAAAPVIDSVYYLYGKLIDNPANPDVYLHDTDEVAVKFTEALKTPPTGDEPILFSTGGAGAPYTVKLLYVGPISGSSAKYKFKVLSLQSGINPAEADPVKGILGDSAKINITAAVTDGIGNIQGNEANRKVGIKVIKPPFELKTKVGPNPFNPRSGAQVRIVLKGKTEVTTKVEFDETTVSIYDKVGNQVFKLPDDDMASYTTRGGKIIATDSCVLVWKGINRNGRVVGSGTYVAIIQSRYKRAEDKAASMGSEVIKIGVAEK